MNPRIVLATAAVLALVVSPGAAQTLTQPNPPTKTPPSAVTTKSRPTVHVKTCDAYGAGFRNIPGTDACIKIGGSVTVDVGLATGALSITDAASDLVSRVPMDPATAREEAAFFAETPGQALTYQIGKTQLIGLIADAVRVRGAGLDLQRLHDQIWVNGNVPIALLRWELLGLTDELAALDID